MSDELLIELVRRYSPSMKEADAVKYLVEWMTGHGFQASVDEAGNACGERGEINAPNTLLLLGHIDTYPGEIPVHVEDGHLYGRGSVDAKGSLCTFAEAAARAIIPDGWKVIIIGAVEEECASSKGAYHVRDLFDPTLCIIGEPSGVDRITLGYKGRLIVDYSVARPAAHSARPEPSVGALGAAFWQAILAWTERENAGVERNFDQIAPRLNAINTETDYFCERVHMTVSFRLPSRFTPDDVVAIVSAFAEPESELRAHNAEHAYLGDKNNALVRGMLSAIRTQGERPAFVLKTGTSDMNVVGAKWKCPIIAYGPGDSSLDHTPNENLALDDYARAVTTLRHFIESLYHG
ncbi:MAG: [LysW]-lysine hydrolase [Burkholderiales bacterium]|nr:[LysW]-lysine hydrolase [Anaerolineae bacterium]